jgi:hypothetical protein
MRHPLSFTVGCDDVRGSTDRARVTLAVLIQIHIHLNISFYQISAEFENCPIHNILQIPTICCNVVQPDQSYRDHKSAIQAKQRR